MPESPEARWLRENWNTLPEDEWVAAGKNGLIEHDRDCGKLLEKLCSKGIKSGDYILAFVPRKDVILQ